MLPNEQPIDTTQILAQPREFAQKLARVERERAELIETVARLRAECNDAQAVARAYILRAEAAENKMLREMVDVDVVIAVMAERDAARQEVARLTAALARGKSAWANFVIVMAFDRSDFSEADQFYFDEINAALRQPAPAPAQDDARDAMIEILDDDPPLIRWQHEADAERNEPAPAGGEARQ